MVSISKEHLAAYIKVLGFIYPTRYIWRPFGTLLEVDRCMADGGLVTNSQASIGRHCGHSMKSPVKISLFEMVLIWLGVIR